MGEQVSSNLTIRTLLIRIGMKIVNYVKESYNELVYKVTWPSRKDLQNSAIVVMIASIIISLVIFVMDLFFENLMDFIYSLFY